MTGGWRDGDGSGGSDGSGWSDGDHDAPLRLGPEHRIGGGPGGTDGGDPLGHLAEIALPKRLVERSRLICHDRSDPAHISFDMLRTRASQALRERGWSRVVVTSPTKGCGKTFVAANLALSLARGRTHRVGLVDLDLRLPGQARLFGIKEPGDLGAALEGAVPLEARAGRVGERLAIAFNDGTVGHPAELLQHPAAGAALAGFQARLGLDIAIYDMPPMLACDDVLALLPNADCVLLVAGGGTTRAEEISRCEQLLEGRAPILGIVLNRAEDPDTARYYY